MVAVWANSTRLGRGKAGWGLEILHGREDAGDATVDLSPTCCLCSAVSHDTRSHTG